MSNKKPNSSSKQIVVFSHDNAEGNDWQQGLTILEIRPANVARAFSGIPHIEKLYELVYICFGTAYSKITLVADSGKKSFDANQIPETSVVCCLDPTNFDLLDHLYVVIEQLTSWQSSYDECCETFQDVIDSLDLVSDFEMKESVSGKFARAGYWNNAALNECLENFESLFKNNFVLNKS